MTSDDESGSTFVASRGILKSCDVHSLTPISSVPILHNYDFRPLQAFSTVYVCTTALRDFINKMWLNMPCPIILVTGDCDISCYSDIFPTRESFLQFIEDPRIHHWYSQNCTGRHPKLTPIPIGLDYHTMSSGNSNWGNRMTPFQQELLLKTIRQEAAPPAMRKIMAYANFQFFMTSRFGGDRKEAVEQVKPNCVFYEPIFKIREESWRTQSTYAFVLSPHGNGMDCHRTWEALALGCFPIVKTSAIDSLYDGLPVWIVEKWSDVTLDNMVRVFADFNSRTFDMERLTLKYWLDIIRNKEKG